MAKQLFSTYLVGVPFAVEAEIVLIGGSRFVKGLEVQMPMNLPDGVTTSDSEEIEYYLPMPDVLLDHCRTEGGIVLRDHFKAQVIGQLSNIGQGDTV